MYTHHIYKYMIDMMFLCIYASVSRLVFDHANSHYPVIRLSAFRIPAIRLSEHSGVKLSGCQAIRLSKLAGPGTLSGYQVILSFPNTVANRHHLVYVYIYVYIYIYVYVYMYICIYVCMCTCICICIYTYIYMKGRH